MKAVSAKSASNHLWELHPVSEQGKDKKVSTICVFASSEGARVPINSTPIARRCASLEGYVSRRIAHESRMEIVVVNWSDYAIGAHRAYRHGTA